MPKNFGLVCTNEKGEKEGIVMIHCAIMGSIERFLGVYIEHCAAHFPLWLAPTQMTILPVIEKHNAHAKVVADALRAKGLRVQLNLATDSLGKRIRNTKTDRTPGWIVIGDNEEVSGTYALEWREGEKEAHMDLAKLTALLAEKIEKKQ
jgi:threonyl-tRNA synthetase